MSTVNQSSVAGYSCLFINVTETTVGSGVKSLIRCQVGSADRFIVANTGSTSVALSDASNIALTLRGAVSQSANLQEWQDSAGTVLASVSSSGFIGLGYTPTVRLHVKDEIRVAQGSGSLSMNLAFESGGTNSAYIRLGRDGRPNTYLINNEVAKESLISQRPAGSAATVAGAEISFSNSEAITPYEIYTRISNGSSLYVVQTISLSSQAVLISTPIAAVKGIVVKGATSQSANLQEWQNSTGTALLSVNASGSLVGTTVSATTGNYWTYGPSGPSNQVGSTFSGTLLQSDSGNTLRIAARTVRVQNDFNGANVLVVEARSGQSVPIMQLKGTSSTAATREQADIDTAWIDSTDATRKARLILRTWDTSAREGLRIDTDGTYALSAFGGNVTATTTLTVNTQSASNIGLVVKGAASQSANLQEWQDSAGTPVLYVDSSQILKSKPSTSGNFTNVQFYTSDGYSHFNIQTYNTYYSILTLAQNCGKIQGPSAVILAGNSDLSQPVAATTPTNGVSGIIIDGALAFTTPSNGYVNVSGNHSIFDMSRTKNTFYGATTGATWYASRFRQTTCYGQQAGNTVTDSATVRIDGPPINGGDGNITLTNVWSLWVGAGTSRFDGAIKPASLDDSAAPNDSIYYSTNASKLVYKDSGGVVNNLY